MKQIRPVSPGGGWVGGTPVKRTNRDPVRLTERLYTEVVEDIVCRSNDLEGSSPSSGSLDRPLKP